MRVVGVSAFIAAAAYTLHAYAEARHSASLEMSAIIAGLAVQYPDPISTSPDAALLLLKSLDSTSFDLRVMDRATGREVRRHHAYNRQMAPSWRPDSKAVAFLQEAEGNQQYRLAIWNVSSDVTIRPDAPPTTALSLAWSPDGTRIAYIVESSTTWAKSLVVVTPGGHEVPRTIATNLALHAAIAWSPDSKVVATTVRGHKGSLLLASLDGTQQHVSVLEDGELRSLVWLPRCACILAAGRNTGDEFMQISSVVPETREVRRVATVRGDISSIAGLGDGYTYQVTTEGRSYAVISRDASAANFVPLESIPGTTLVFGASAHGDTVFGVHTGLTSPPALIGVLLHATTTWVERSFSASEERTRYVAAHDVRLLATDGQHIPAYVWLAEGRRVDKRALVLVHGGPALQTMRTWDGGIQNAVRAGFNVIAVNYRGSSGYGAKFELLGDDIDGQVTDIEAACRYAQHALGVPPEKVVLWGHSHGALLVSRAVAANPWLVGRAIIISLVPDPEAPPAVVGHGPRIFMFQGAHDVVESRGAARDQVTDLFGHLFRWRYVRDDAVGDEGHNFHRLQSWARVYTAALHR